jgi:3'-phosphoadenosine 5'-phosphosulfate sulfotransferase (PAPS reductase)/FAD synthetase
MNVEEMSLDDYDMILVAYSGGKDSLASLLDLLERGVDPSKIELHHHDIDGEGEALMDWPCTRSYVQATAEALNLPIVYSWREGGFVREMLRHEVPTAPVRYERRGELKVLPTKRNTPGSRLKFPQVSADLSVRWCSAYLKIDVMARVVANDPAYQGKRLLIVTGERREESTARSKYKEYEVHRTNSRKRVVHQWRNVLGWSEEQVWAAIRRWNIRPHPAYLLGWGRVSCMACIFGDDDQWASVDELSPDRIDRIDLYEIQFGTTIRKGRGVRETIERGREFVSDKPEALKALAMSDGFTADIFFMGDEPWTMPAGAFKRCGGPT